MAKRMDNPQYRFGSPGNMLTGWPSRRYSFLFLIGLLTLSPLARAQHEKPALLSSRQTHPQPAERRQSGYQTQITGWIIYAGDTLQLGQGSRPGKEFAYVYQHMAPAASARRQYLTAEYSGQKAILKERIAGEIRGPQSSPYALLSIGDLPLYYTNLDSAINAGEILPPIKYRPSAQASPALPVSVAQALINLKAQRAAGQISQSEFEAKKKKLLE